MKWKKIIGDLEQVSCLMDGHALFVKLNKLNTQESINFRKITSQFLFQWKESKIFYYTEGWSSLAQQFHIDI